VCAEESLRPGARPVPGVPEAALEALVERGYSACEIDFEGRFWMDYDFAGALRRACRDAGSSSRCTRRSPASWARGARQEAEHGRRHARPLRRDREGRRRRGRGLPPGYLLGRTREEAIDSVVEQLGELRARLEKKDRGVPFGIEVMGRVRELGTADDVVEISRRLGWVRPVLDFAHMHATSDGGFTSVEPFAEALAKADAVLEPGAPFHIHFSDIQFANRNETKAPLLRRGDAARGAAARCARRVRASCDSHLRVTRRGVESDDKSRARRLARRAAGAERERALLLCVSLAVPAALVEERR
jgi:sugar phosphate isomerase/epimerase